MRRVGMLVGLLAFSALVPTMAACGGKEKAASSGAGGKLPETIRIGATSEKTGPVPVLGHEAKGYLAAAKWINAHGGIAGHKVEVTVHDNAGNPGKAVSDVRSFSQQGYKIILGGAFGADCAAEAPVAVQEKVIVFCGSTDNLPDPDDHMFGVGLGYTPTIKSAADRMVSKFSQKPAVFADKTKSGDDSAREAPLRLREAGTDPMLFRTQPTEASFKATIQKAIAAGADGLWFTECTPAAISAVGEAQALGFKDKIYLENCLASFGVAQALKGLAGTNNQILIQAPDLLLPSKASRPGLQEAIARFKQAVPGPPDVVVASGWDAMFIVKKLLEQTNTLDVDTNLKALEDNFEFTGPWHGGTFTAHDHRGAVAEGYATPAAFTNKGTFVAVK
jgi:branched-chain amino acid transport system substrate-binding protein